jgi:hypothetical protein
LWRKLANFAGVITKNLLRFLQNQIEQVSNICVPHPHAAMAYRLPIEPSLVP